MTATLNQPVAAQQAVADLARGMIAGIEARDPDALACLYAESAELTLFNRNHPPGQPMVIRGRAAIRQLYADILAIDVAHRTEAVVVGDNAFAFEERCQYAEGGRVAGNCIAQVRDGLIWRQSSVDVWDE
jgi:hypothetical protein